MKRIFYVFMVLFLWLGIGANSLQAQNALNFDGADDYVDCGNSAALQLSTGTIETWVKTSGAGASYRGIVVKQLAYSLFLVDNVLTVYNWGSSVANSTTVNLADGQWHHVAMSFQSGVTNGTKVYVDGVLRTTITLTNSAQTSPLTLGAGSTTTGQNMNGTMKGTRIWNTVRTATEIANYRFTETVGTETGLVAAYNFNQGTANGTNTGVTTLNDVKASNNGTLTNFALTGATSNWVTGFTFASALSFDGTNDLVNCGNAASVQLATGTIEAWIKTSGAGASFRSIVAKPLAYSLFLKDNVLIAYDWVNGEKSTGVNLADGQWHHVALSFQPSANLSKIYIDGVPRLTIATAWGVNAQTSPLLIGDGDLAGGQSFNGSIDEVRVWNTARTDGQIASNYSCQLVGNESGLAAYYKFSQGFAAGTNTGLTTLIDATANANNGTLTNFTLTGATSNWITSGASTTVTPSVSIVANVSGTISPTTSVTFTATPTNGGDSPTYQWKKNGANVGTNSATYTDATWANNDVVTCVLTSSSSCASPTTATSNAVTLSVTTTVTPSVSIAASATTVCGTGTSVTFTATPTNGGTPTYVWKKNGNTISGEVSSTYTTTDLANGDMISCVMTSSLANATPTTATSNSVTMTVNALPSVTLSNTGANSLVGTAVLSVNSTTATDIKWYNGATLANTSAVSATGTTVAGGNGQGAAANQLNQPNHIYVDGSGNIYISDFLNHRIQKWAPGATSGTTVAGGNGSGSAANQLYRPSAIRMK